MRSTPFIFCFLALIALLLGIVFYLSPKEDWIGYEDEQHGFSLSYPSEFTASNTTLTLYPPERILQGLKVSRNLPVQNCGESGLPEHCRPFTENPGIGFFVLEGALEEVVAPVREYLGDLVTPASLAGREGYLVELGAEGEGLFTYYLPLRRETTLIVTRTYIDERNQIAYAGVPDFLPLEAQKKLFEDIIATLKIK